MSESPLAELFEPFADQARRALEQVAAPDDVDDLLVEARSAFQVLAPEMPYTDRRDHIMWAPTLAVFRWLAVHLACREKGIDAHALGRAMLALDPSEDDGGGPSEMTEQFVTGVMRDALASQQGAPENEFVFELVPGEDAKTDWGMNITSCAVCHAYAKHDAMDFTPYMCAYDDVVSDRSQQGLRRTGTIALGADRCDFRYKAGGEPLRLAAQYPDRIRTGDTPED